MHKRTNTVDIANTFLSNNKKNTVIFPFDTDFIGPTIKHFWYLIWHDLLCEVSFELVQRAVITALQLQLNDLNCVFYEENQVQNE